MLLTFRSTTSELTRVARRSRCEVEQLIGRPGYHAADRLWLHNDTELGALDVPSSPGLADIDAVRGATSCRSTSRSSRTPTARTRWRRWSCPSCTG
jgi:hypothetical protein